jgi:hypothetical protein
LKTKQPDVSPSETTKIASISGFISSSYCGYVVASPRFSGSVWRFHRGIALVRCGPSTESAWMATGCVLRVNGH